MPTKLNKAGNQQNYVPAGHGDASGEYGDNATGSNVHIQFTSFKKPDGNENKVEESIKIQPNQKPNNTSKNFNDYVDNNFKNNSKMAEGLKTSFNAGNEEQKDKLNYFVSNDIIKISETKGISNYGYGVSLNVGSIQDKKGALGKENGETLYHEFGHAYDEYFAKGWVDKDGNKIFDGLITKDDEEKLNKNNDLFNAFMLRGNLSTSKYLSNGKTLYETIQAEGRSMTKNKIWDKIIADYHQDIKDEVNAKYPDYYKSIETINTLREQVRKEASDLYPYKYGDDAVWRKRQDYMDNKLNSPEIAEINEKIKNTSFEVYKIEANVLKKYSNLSDMYGIYKKIPYGFGSGHTGNYGKTKGAIAHEFFAEYNSSRARDDEFAKKQMELYEKYMPESTKMAKELFGLMDDAWKGIKR